jgi:hypothetical protein
MAFNIPGILGRNRQARQSMVEDTVADAHKAGERRFQDKYHDTRELLVDRIGKKQAEESAKTIGQMGYENVTNDRMTDAVSKAASKVEELKYARANSKWDEEVERRPGRGEVRGAKKDVKALKKAEVNVARDLNSAWNEDPKG